MKSTNISFLRMISSILIVIFMIFSTPIPVAESGINEPFARLIHSTSVETAAKPSVRKDQPMLAKLKLAAFMAVLLFHAAAQRKLPLPLPAAHVFRPFIARRLILMKLTPVKCTSLFV
ncbi:hypothetical protein FHS18_003986 [Paenibacillus phyllosphaerae]|uniref:Uncharacterized protein n=1 Tax=Paenibacillus phyllosphaerae TaxID=274593 RepID=A0A7W5B008_9BACL|nr:hypothetical protein [Paenibacillus phyllosphaerae]MBB3111918.1 hypothetical protein [Paenibacillus phyllosphaerae]